MSYASELSDTPENTLLAEYNDNLILIIEYSNSCDKVSVFYLLIVILLKLVSGVHIRVSTMAFQPSWSWKQISSFCDSMLNDILVETVTEFKVLSVFKYPY